MPGAQPLPRKYLGTIRDATENLKSMANRIHLILENSSERERPILSQTRTTLQTLQSSCYAIALALSEVELADNCDTCPLAPPSTSAEVHLTLLSQKLSHLANETRYVAHIKKGFDHPSDSAH